MVPERAGLLDSVQRNPRFVRDTISATSQISIPDPVVPKPAQGSGNGCLPGEEDTDLVQEVSGTLVNGEHSPVGGQDFCVPAIIT